MKSLSGIAAILILAVSLSAQVVNIPDAGLEGEIRNELGKDTGDITQTDMLGLTSLIADYANISDLTGLQFATNLQTLSLYSNDVTDLTPLSGLTSLSVIYISFNPNLQDISPLAELAGLTELTLDNNAIDDITPLVALSNLDYLFIYNNFINFLPSSNNSDALTTIAANNPGITIDSNNQSVDTPDTNLRAKILAELDKPSDSLVTYADILGLTSLIADYANITDLTGLEFATNLQTLSLYSNDVTDLTPISGLTSLSAIYISFNPNLQDISPLAELAGLTDLTLDNNAIDDITSLVALSNLNYLFINDNFINFLTSSNNSDALTTIAANNPGITIDANNQSVDTPDTNLRAKILAELDKPSDSLITYADILGLTSLSANFANITDLTGLEFATNLQTLSLYRNDITDISPLQNLTELETLSLSSNAITDISPLQNLTELETLSLSSNAITDISPLQNLTQLETLFLSNNTITDISALTSFRWLSDLELRNNYLNLLPNSDVSNDLNTIINNNSTLTLVTTGQYLEILDPNLYALLITRMGETDGYKIYQSDMETLAGTINLNDGLNISTLEGLQFASAINTLNLGDNPIRDLSPLTINPTYALASISVGNPDALDWNLDNTNVAAIEQLLDDGVDLNGLRVPLDAIQIRIEAEANNWRITYGPLLTQQYFQRNSDLANPNSWHDITLSDITETSRPLEYTGTTYGPPSPDNPFFFRFSNTPKSIFGD